MSLEAAVSALNENVVAMNANFEAILARLNNGEEPKAAPAKGSKEKAAAEKPAATTKGKAASSKKVTSEFNEDEVKAMAVKIKDQYGTGEAKKLIKTHGKADSLAEIEPENYDAFMEACQKKIEADNGGDGEDDDI